MSESSNGSIKAILISALIGLLVLAMIGMGMADVFTAPTRNAAATVGKDKVDINEFDRLFRAQLQERNLASPERITIEQAYGQGLHRQVLQGLITNKLVELDADDLGLEVNNNDARAFVEDLDVFNDALSGEFDEQKLRSYLYNRDDKMSQKQYEQQVRNALRSEQSTKSLNIGIVVPNSYVNNFNNYMKETRNVELLLITTQALTKLEDPSDEDLKLFIDENAARYTAPEYRRFTILRLETADLLRDIEISDEEIKKQFDYKIKVKKLGTIETRSVITVMSPDKETADKVTTAVRSGQSAEAAASALGADIPETFTDVIATGVTDPNSGEAAYEMKSGEVRTVEGALGNWYSVQLTGITPAIIPDLETETPAIIAELKNINAQRMVYEIIDKAEESLEDGLPLETVGKNHGIPVASYDYISRLGQTQDGIRLASTDEFTSLIEDEKILTEIFTAEVGPEGNFFETATKGYTSVRVDEIIESTRRPFEDIREQALEDWHFIEADKAISTLVNDLSARARTGESLEDISAGFEKGTITTSTMMARELQTPIISGAVTVRIFDARVGDVVQGKTADNVNRVIARITDVTPYQGALPAADTQALLASANTAIQNDIWAAYSADILKENPAEYVDPNIQAVLGINTKSKNAP